MTGERAWIVDGLARFARLARGWWSVLGWLLICSAALAAEASEPGPADATEEPSRLAFAGKTFFRTDVQVYSDRCVWTYHTDRSAPPLWREVLKLTRIWDLSEASASHYLEDQRWTPHLRQVGAAKGVQQDARNGDRVLESIDARVRERLPGGLAADIPWLFWKYTRARQMPRGVLLLDYIVADRTGEISEKNFAQRMGEEELPPATEDFQVLDRVVAATVPIGVVRRTLSLSDSTMRFAEIVLEPDGSVEATLIEPVWNKRLPSYPSLHRRAGMWSRRGDRLELNLAL